VGLHGIFHQVDDGENDDLLFNLCSEHGLTLVLVTHNRELAKRCDRALLLKDGALNKLGK